MSTYVLEQTVPIKRLLLSRMFGVAGMALTTTPPSSIVGAMLWAGYLGHTLVTHLSLIQA
jgi:hypothetical protein